MKILVTLHDEKNLAELSTYADGFIIGNSKFGARLTSSFSCTQINHILNTTDKEIFININQIYTDDQLDELSLFIKRLETKLVTGFIFADIGVMEILKDLSLVDKGVYNPETLLTNYFDFNYLSSSGIKGAFVAKEITLNDIDKVGQEKKYDLFCYGHGHLNMFYSKRKLLTNYQEYIGRPIDTNQSIHLIEEKREATPYPILEDSSGTHVFRSHIFSSLYALHQLRNVVDYLIIETIFCSDEYAAKVLPLYKNGDISQAKLVEKEYNQVWDDGFLNKKTIYKTRGQDND